jgi:CRISPR/Cas system-associated exonuclease Cas4 (RecB family)
MSYTWSYSALKEYTNCPKQYQEIKVLKRVSKKQTEQMLYGTEVHKALEDYVRDGTPLLKNYQRFQPVLDALVAIKGTKYPEHEMALDRNKQPIAFDSEDRWVRGIVDLLIVDGDTAHIVDYKTGSNKYPDAKQLKLMALMTFAHFPEVQKIKAGLLFVMHNSFMPEEYDKEDTKDLWNYFTPDLERLTVSYQNDTWMANPTPLCGWCPVKECEYHKGR